MRKLLLSTSLILSSLCASAALSGQWQWSKVLDAGDAVMSNIDAVVPAAGGNYFIAGNFSKSTTLTWGDINVAPSDAMTFAYQKNFMVAMIDAEGNLKWHVVPTLANTANNSISLASTPDGGVVMTCNATFNSNKGADTPLLMTLTGTDGKAVSLKYEGTPADKAPYAGVILKFSGDGAVEWGTVVTADCYGDADLTAFDANALSVNDVAVDGEGNIFIGGYYKTTVDFGNGVTAPKALNGNVKDGKVADNGDAFIAKFGADGKAVKVLVNGGSAPYASKEVMSRMAVSGGKLYCAGIVNGLAGAAYSLFGKSCEISDEVSTNIVYGVVDCATLECESANALKSTVTDDNKTHNAQIQAMNLSGSHLYICGSLQGGFEQDGSSLGVSTAIYQATGKYALENMTVAVDLDDLKAVRLYLSGKAIGNDYSAIESAVAGRLYTYGYVMGENSCSLTGYDLASGEPADETLLWKNASNLRAAYFNNDTKQLLGTCYSKGLTDIFGTDGGTDSYAGFHGFLTSVSLPDLIVSSGVEEVAEGGVSEAGANAEYYNLQGQRIENPLSGTIVIRRCGATAEKIVVR